MKNDGTRKKKRSDGEGNKEGDDLKTICGFDPTFNVALVYAYGSFEAYSALETKLFSTPEKSVSARSCCSFGIGARDIDTMVGLAWVNSKKCKFEHSLPAFLHETVHLSQAILDFAGVKDASGELQAYTVERECERLLRELYNQKLPTVKAEAAIKAVLENLKKE